MKISVIIPAHNEEKFLPTALRAILKSDYPDFEVIVVDNASTDKTFSVASSFPGVKVVRELNKGTQHARERGRKEAKGEIIAQMDADCIPPRDWLTRGTEILKKERAVAISGPVYYFDAVPWFRYLSFWVQRTVYFSMNALLRGMDKGGIMLAGNSLIKSDALQKIGGHDTSFVFYGDDTDTVKRLAKVGKVVFDNRFVMDTSSRRFKTQGIIKTEALYVYHFFKVLFKKRS